MSCFIYRCELSNYRSTSHLINDIVNSTKGVILLINQTSISIFVLYVTFWSKRLERTDDDDDDDDDDDICLTHFYVWKETVRK